VVIASNVPEIGPHELQPRLEDHHRPWREETKSSTLRLNTSGHTRLSSELLIANSMGYMPPLNAANFSRSGSRIYLSMSCANPGGVLFRR